MNASRFLPLLLLSLLVALSTCQEDESKCANDYESSGYKCWDDSIAKTSWSCDHSYLKSCMQDEHLGGAKPCDSDAKYVERKRQFMDVIKVFDKWFCQESKRTEVLYGECEEATKKSSGVAFTIFLARYSADSDCTQRHFKLEQDIQRQLPRPSGCRDQVLRPMLHEALQQVVCRDFPDEPWETYARLDAKNFTFCNRSFDALESCKPAVTMDTACKDDSRLSDCVQKFFQDKSVKPCPLEGVKKWQEKVLRQVKQREGVFCETAFYNELKMTNASCQGASLFMLSIASMADTPEACEGYKVVLESMKTENTIHVCGPTTELMKRNIGLVCPELAAPTAAEGGSSGAAGVGRLASVALALVPFVVASVPFHRSL